MATTRPQRPADDEIDGVEPNDTDEVKRPEQPPMDDAAGLPDDEAEKLGDFA